MKTRNFALAVGLVVAALILIEAKRAFGQVVNQPFTLQWDDPNPPGFVTNYKIYKLNGTNWTSVGTSTNTTWNISLPPGIHTLAVSAVNGTGLESAKSTSIDLAVLLAVINLRVTQP